MTGIEWTQEVWNPTTGCDRVSPGCDNCYALTMAKRLKGMGQAKYQRDGDPRTSGPGFRLTTHAGSLDVPLRWREPRRVFVNSMSDLFHKDVPDGFIACVFAVMARTPQHTYQMLTKRHGRMRSLLNSDEFRTRMWLAAMARGWDLEGTPWPLPNLWVGVSVENQHWAGIRIPALLDTPAAVRFISAEPLIGPINIRKWLQYANDEGGAEHRDPCELAGDRSRIGWLIAGGESGPGARPCELAWLRQLHSQCAESGTAFFCKQLGSVLGRELGAGPKGGDMDAWPEDLRVREFPRTTEVVAA